MADPIENIGTTAQTMVDSYGRILQQLNADGSTTFYSYDNVGVLTAVSENNEDESIVADPDLIPPALSTQYEYDQYGQLISETHVDGSHTAISNPMTQHEEEEAEDDVPHQATHLGF